MSRATDLTDRLIDVAIAIALTIWRALGRLFPDPGPPED